MTTDETTSPARVGPFAPLRQRVFRNIWLASLMSNFGQLMLGVAAAWQMTLLTSSAEMVALVQTAMMLPLFLVSVPAGAIADMFDRRKIALIGLGVASASAAVLTTISVLDLMTPWLLLGFCVLIGGGVALYAPAWQASISEQVDADHLPQAIALGTISYNIARSFGPALGGAIVLAFGAQAAFGINALFYLPLFFALFLWRRVHVPARLPPERLDRAIVSGVRYAFHSPSVRNVVVRAFVVGIATASQPALSPLVASTILNGNAGTFGLMLAAMGVGAVVGALYVGRLRDTLMPERAATWCVLVTAAMFILIGWSQWLLLTCVGMFIVGGSATLTSALMNVAVQTAAPRWVTARALSLYSSALTGGIAIGSWLWGSVAAATDISTGFYISAAAMAATPLLGLVLPMRQAREAEAEPFELGFEPEVALNITLRSGPVAIEIEYQVDPDQARNFYAVMLKMQRARQRRGGFNWSLSRDIADSSIWVERYQCPTWGDYLRQRSRFTQADRELQAEADAFIIAGKGGRVRRMLERPFGSVRRSADSPDTGSDGIGIITP